MNHLDTNINNYSNEEILRLFKINEENCSLDTLFVTVIEALDQINESPPLANEKKNIMLFFRQCFYKICSYYRMKPSNAMNKLIETKIEENIINETIIEESIINNSNLSSKENFIPKTEHFVGALPLKIPEAATVSSNVDKYARGLVNPLQRETVNNILIINSKFRNDKQSTTTDFSVLLTEPINNVISLKMASLELMNSYYAISDALKTNVFTIQTYKINTSTKAITDIYIKEIQLTEGGYNSGLLVTTFNTMFNADPSLNMLTTQYNVIKGRIYFFIKSAPPVPPPSGTQYAFNLSFTLPSDKTRPLFLNFGWLLGYQKADYIFSKDYITTATTTQEIGFNPESPLDLTGTKFFLLEVTDYNNNAPAVLKYNTADGYWFNIKDVLAKIPNVSPAYSVIFEDSSDRVFKTRNYFGPVKLQKLRIRLLDENGRVVDLNCSDMVISFEVESLDVRYSR